MVVALVYDIQRFCLQDGPGVRTTVFFKGCPLRCPWCSNPESISPDPELYYIRSKCIGCGECVRAAPSGLLRLESGKIAIDREKWDGDFSFIDVCPTRALARKGVEMSAADLLAEALKDREFYIESGGGVTVSGGEPLLQAEAAAEFLALVREAGVHTAMETSGFASRQALDLVLPHCDLVYIDLKHIDPAMHRELVGVDNRPILATIEYLAGAGKKTVARMPLIPGCNMDEGALAGAAAFLGRLGVPVEPLSFHQLGRNKYRSIGRDYRLGETGTLAEPDFVEAVRFLASHGVQVI